MSLLADQQGCEQIQPNDGFGEARRDGRGVRRRAAAGIVDQYIEPTRLSEHGVD